MAIGDRFDPVAYGEGNGLSKVNLRRHEFEISDENLRRYQSMFEDRFRNAGIVSYLAYASIIKGSQPR